MTSPTVEAIERVRDRLSVLPNGPLANDLALILTALDQAREALRPFAALTPSSFFPPDGSEAESYQVHLWDGDGRERADFNGADLAAARAVLALLEPSE